MKLTGSLQLGLQLDGKLQTVMELMGSLPTPLVKTGQLVILTQSEIVVVPLAVFGGRGELQSQGGIEAKSNIFTTIKTDLESQSDGIFRANFLHNALLSADAQGNINLGAIRLTAGRFDGEALGNIEGRTLIVLGARGETTGQSDGIFRSGLLSSIASTLSAQPTIDPAAGLIFYPVALCSADGTVHLTGRIVMGLRMSAEGESEMSGEANVDFRGKWLDGQGYSEIVARVLSYKPGLLNLATASDAIYRGDKIAWSKSDAASQSDALFPIIRRTDAGASHSSSGALEALGRVAINARMNELQGTSEAIYAALRIAYAMLASSGTSEIEAKAIYKTSGRLDWAGDSDASFGAGLKQPGDFSSTAQSHSLWRSILTANARIEAQSESDMDVSARIAQSIRNEMSSAGAIVAGTEKSSFARLVEAAQSSMLLRAIASYYVFCNLSALSSAQFRGGFDRLGVLEAEGDSTCSFDAVRIGLRFAQFNGTSNSELPQPTAIVVNTAPNDYRLQVGNWGYYVFFDGLETDPTDTNTGIEMGGTLTTWIPWSGTQIAGTTATGAVNL